MPIWLYDFSPLGAALTIMLFVEVSALAGLFLARRFLTPRLRYDGETNEAISGTVQAIGVFYGITVGLIAAGVWSTHTTASELASKEANSIGALYRDVSSYPTPPRDELRAELRRYTIFIIEQAWPAQQKGRGQTLTAGVNIMDDFQRKLNAFEPATTGQAALHAETLKAYNTLIENRQLRIDAVASGLSPVMWAVIWVGAAISIGVAYLYRIEDLKLHAALVSLMGGFLAVVLFMIVINDKPFYGHVGVSSEPYQLILHRLIDRSD